MFGERVLLVLVCFSSACQVLFAFRDHKIETLTESGQDGRKEEWSAIEAEKEYSSKDDGDVFEKPLSSWKGTNSSAIGTVPKSMNSKRRIFSPDDRIRVKTPTAQVLPFKAVVKVSVSALLGSCSGILIGPSHVLTAAHCIHDGRAFKTSKRTIKVGVLQPNRRFTWYRIENVSLPRAWYRGQRMNPEFDYAVLTLRRPHGRPFVQIKAFSIKRLLGFTTMHFACFPNDKRLNTMWYSSCLIEWQPNDAAHRGIVLSKCDAAGGCSGAGVYVINRSGENRWVVGVLSASIADQAQNIVTRFTPRKIKEICGWIGNLKQSGCITKKTV